MGELLAPDERMQRELNVMREERDTARRAADSLANDLATWHRRALDAEAARDNAIREAEELREARDEAFAGVWDQAFYAAALAQVREDEAEHYEGRRR